MMSGSRRIRPARPFLLLSLLAAIALAAGCSTANTTAGDASNMNHIDASGQVVPGWLVVPSGGDHTTAATLDYIASGGQSNCGQCHGSDLAGGIDGVSCFQNPAGCHHGPVAGWVADSPAVQEHGVSAKKAPGSSGFASCQICHGSDFSGGGSQKPCFTCHTVDAPHPPKPWLGTAYTHINTDPQNASVCRQCHYPGSPNNPAGHPPTPAPAGTPPGCFNNTLCHGEAAAPHPVDNTWVTTPPAPQPHGTDAKAAPGLAAGFLYCQGCHGTDQNFDGGISGVSCTNTAGCHGAGVFSPHPQDWLQGDTYVHTSTDVGNARVCAYCHTGGDNSPIPPPSPAPPAGTEPGCFNGTLCHANVAPHPLDNTWVTTPPAPEPHGDDAKAVPGTATGFLYCQGCHGTGTDFAGGSSGSSCYPCHGNVGTPHPADWLSTDTYVHVSTDGGNAPVCAFCHTAGNNSPIGPPNPPAPAGTPAGCFNSTLCHAAGGAVPHPVDNTWVTLPPAAQPHGNDAKAAPSAANGTGFAYCQVCHGSGTTPPANFGGGSSGPSCYGCHGVSAPHAPAPWRTSAGSTYTHTNTNAGNASICVQCHYPGSPNNPANHPVSPAPPGTPPGCFNSTLCH